MLSLDRHGERGEMVKRVAAGVLDVAYEEFGEPGGPAVILLHGFPYDVLAYGEVAPRLADAGAHVIVPYLRGYGATRFRSIPRWPAVRFSRL